MTESVLDMLQDEVGKCISCGFCESVCPTLPASGYDLWKGARGRVIMGHELVNAVREGKAGQLDISDSFYSCLDCFACLQVCPAGVNAGVVSHLARSLIVERQIRENQNPYARMIVAATMKYMNPLGVPASSDNWAEGLKFDQDSPDLLYTGSMYQLMAYTGGLNRVRQMAGDRLSKMMAGIIAGHPSAIRVSTSQRDRSFQKQLNNSLRNIVRLLQAAGNHFSYLGPGEPYPGTFIYDLGYLEEFREYANRVYRMLKESGARRIITVDPHTYDLLKHTYPEYVEGFDLDVVFYADLLSGLNISKIDRKVVYHEPCHFVLRADSYTVPLTLISRAAETVMAPRNGKRNKCCGGPDELIFPDLSEKVSNERYSELVSTGASEIITACPICLANLSKEKKTRDMADLLSEACFR
ncbi:MAG: (Fe-S)-binding protein [Candidatus Thermoplasmatota archaeon]|nr:(Fe-S)-binding protein [Candidatus Thermoplasmatota archaeon]